MNYNQISSTYANLSVVNDVIFLETSEPKKSIPLDAVESITFKKYTSEEKPGYIKFTLKDRTVARAYFEQKDEDVFHNAFNAIGKRHQELQNEDAEEETVESAAKQGKRNRKADPEDSSHKGNGFATTALVLGIIGICTSFVPIINNASFFLGLIAIIFAIIALVKKASKGKTISSLVLGILAVVITLSLQAKWSKDLSNISASADAIMASTSTEMDNATGDNTEEILKNNLTVDMGTFSAVTDQYNLTTTELPVTLTNIGTESKSFMVHLEAVDADGNRIVDDTLYANSLGAGQSEDMKAFQLITSDKVEAVKSATFRIVEVSMY